MNTALEYTPLRAHVSRTSFAFSRHNRAVDSFNAAFGRTRQYVTVKEAADLFGCSTRTIRRQFAHCLITVPGGVRIHRSDVIAAIM